MEVESPLLTSRHVHHSAVWCIDGFSLPKLCIACATERLEDKGELGVHLRKILSEFQALLSVSRDGGSCKLSEVLNRDQRVMEHLCGLLYGLLLSEEVSTAQLSLNVLMLMLGHTTNAPILARKLMERTVHTVVTSHNFQTSLPLLTFLGKLLHSNDNLCSEITKSFGSFIEFLIGGITYPDENVKSTVVYILLQVCSKAPPNSLSVPLVQNICRHISTSLANSKSQELTINLLGFIRHLLKNGTYSQCLLQADRLNSEAKGSTFASAFKRVLLSRDELIQVSGAQCVAEVLAHHLDYGKMLLKADIAEFMFEALSSKNELLINSLFSCLNLLASIEDFYAKCHTVYAIDPVITGIATALRLRNYDAAQLGFHLLSQMLSRQPCGMPLLTSPDSLSNLLELTNTALQVPSPAVSLQASLALSSLLSIQHIPPDFTLNKFLPLMALLLHQIELLMPQDDPGEDGCTSKDQSERTTTSLSPASKKRMCASYVAMENLNRLLLECSKKSQHKSLVTEEVIMFVCTTYEESVIPPLLFYIDEFDEPKPFISILSIASCQFDIRTKKEAHNLAKILVYAGFVQLTFDLRSKLHGTQNFEALRKCINIFLVHLCFHLEDRNEACATYIRELLHTALPHIDCSAVDCLKFLCQRTGGGGNLPTLQCAVLALFYYVNTHLQDEELNLVSQCDLQKALSTFLSLNPNIHLLPPATLTHLTVLYVQAFSDQLYPQSSQILARGLQIISNPETVFVPQPPLLKWAFAQESLVQCGLAKSWLTKWLQILAKGSCDPDEFIEALHAAPSVMTHLIDVLTDDEESVAHFFIENVISKSPQHREVVARHIQSAIVTNHLEPLSNSAMVTMLSVLLMVQKSSQEQLDIKVIYQFANILTRVVLDIDDEDCDVKSSQVAKYAMELLTDSLTQLPSDTPSQVPMLLLSNSVLIQRVAHLSSPPKKSSTTGQVELDKSSLISALMSPLITAQVAGLKFWTVLFKNDGQTGCFMLKQVTNDRDNLTKPSSQWECVKVVLFLVKNLLIKDIKVVCESAALCYTEIVRYIISERPSSSSDSSWPFDKDHFWHSSYVDYVTDVYHSSTLPLIYIPCLAALVEVVSPATVLNREKQNKLAQLLYKTYMSYSETEVNQSQKEFQTCFMKLHISIPNALTTTQWSALEERFNFY